MKKIYFVRHGQSEGNVGGIRQNAHSPLSKNGLRQAQIVAQRLEGLDVDVVFSSSMVRATQTAQEIGSLLSKPVTQSDLYRGRRRPSIQIGTVKDDPLAQKASREIRENFNVEGWRHSDEENFQDLKERARGVLRHIENMEEEKLSL